MARVSVHFGLEKQQGELDFVDVDLDADIALFIDPFAISQRPDKWSQDCHTLLKDYFQQVVTAITSGDLDRGRELLSNLHEPNETRFGFSAYDPAGAGLADGQAEDLLQALQSSEAVKTGLLSNLEEAELMVPGIGHDKISDLTTNVLRKPLAAYTKDQCDLHGIPTQSVSLNPYYDDDLKNWNTVNFDVPVVNDRPLVLVPKSIVRRLPAYSYGGYYSHVVNHLAAYHLEANTSLVRTLKRGAKRVYKKDVKATFARSKENLFEFSRKNPGILVEYRQRLQELEAKGLNEAVSRDEEVLLASSLAAALRAIPAGNDNASAYHKLMIGIVEFIFYPSLIHPRKEREIHDGRKRVDITMENSAASGVFERLHRVRKVPCGNIFIECKNYSSDPANPELDQLAGRFGVNRGKAGILLCRTFEDRDLFVQRCTDTVLDDRGLIIPLSDTEVLELLSTIEDEGRGELDELISDYIDEVWSG
jgi:hypothetical protein